MSSPRYPSSLAGNSNESPLGTWANPIRFDGPIPSEYPKEYADRPYIYVVPKSGEMTKWYRSYSDYCD